MINTIKMALSKLKINTDISGAVVNALVGGSSPSQVIKFI
jgi:hypothetical protein